MNFANRSRLRQVAPGNVDGREPGNTKGGSITVPLTSCLTGLVQSVLQIKTIIVGCHTANSKPVKQTVNSTVILPPLVFPGENPKVVWAEFSTLSQAVLLHSSTSAQHTSSCFYSSKFVLLIRIQNKSQLLRWVYSCVLSVRFRRLNPASENVSECEMQFAAFSGAKTIAENAEQNKLFERVFIKTVFNFRKQNHRY